MNILNSSKKLILLSLVFILIIWNVFVSNEKTIVSYPNTTIKIESFTDMIKSSDTKIKNISNATLYKFKKESLDTTINLSNSSAKSLSNGVYIKNKDIIIDDKRYSFYGFISINGVKNIVFYTSNEEHKSEFLNIEIGDILDDRIKVDRIDKQYIYITNQENNAEYKLDIGFINEKNFTIKEEDDKK